MTEHGERPGIIEGREKRLAVLRAMLDTSIAAGGEVSESEIDEALNAKADQLRREGF